MPYIAPHVNQPGVNTLQIMIDTAETMPAEIRAAINFLTALLPVEKTETPPVFPGTLPEPPPPPADLDVDTYSEP